MGGQQNIIHCIWRLGAALECPCWQTVVGHSGVCLSSWYLYFLIEFGHEELMWQPPSLTHGSFLAVSVSLPAVRVSLALQNLWHGESFRCYFNKPEQHPEGKPFQASHSAGGCCQSCSQVSPLGLQQENVTNKSHSKLLLFTMTSWSISFSRKLK